MYIVTHNNLGRCLSVPHLCSKHLLATSAFILVIERQLQDFLDKHPNFRHFNQEMTLVDAVFEYCEY